MRPLSFMNGNRDYTRPTRGDLIGAVVLDISPNDILVDLGTRRDGLIPAPDLETVDGEYLSALEVGDRIPVVVTRTRGKAVIEVSLTKGIESHDWLHAQDMLESGQTCSCAVEGFNRRGVVVRFGGLLGFVPNAHLGIPPSGLREGRCAEKKSELVGKTLPLAVIDADRRHGRLILSRRAAIRRRRGNLLKELTPGEVRTGIVGTLVSGGVFVDLGGLDGLIPISELDWQSVWHPSEVLSLGDEVEVHVLGVDLERQRVELSRKRLLPDPWESATGSVAQGDIVDGVVTNLVPFGVFVDIGAGVEGLVQVSEMPRGFSELIVGLEVKVRVLEIDREAKTVSLSLRLDEPTANTPTA